MLTTFVNEIIFLLFSSLFLITKFELKKKQGNMYRISCCVVCIFYFLTSGNHDLIAPLALFLFLMAN